jgi:hypothetical protein
VNDRPPVTRQPTDNLSELAAVMLRALTVSPAGEGVRAVVFLDDAEHGTVAMTGYAEADVPGRVIADIADHAAHYAEAYGVPLLLALAAPGSELTLSLDAAGAEDRRAALRAVKQAALRRACPTCGAEAGQGCRTEVRGRPLRSVHGRRFRV